jgi:hypothetical protein
MDPMAERLAPLCSLLPNFLKKKKKKKRRKDNGINTALLFWSLSLFIWLRLLFIYQ